MGPPSRPSPKPPPGVTRGDDPSDTRPRCYRPSLVPPLAPLLAGTRIVESSMLGPGAITTHLADLGADVIKVEPPGGDYIRQMTWPLVEGVSLMHLHISRGKRSIVLDLRTAEGVSTYLDLVRGADGVVEGMRPGGLERRGLGYERLQEVDPRIVVCTL